MRKLTYFRIWQRALKRMLASIEVKRTKYMPVTLHNSAYIRIILLVSAAGVVAISVMYTHSSETLKKEMASIPNFVREPTPQDVQPMLEIGGDLEKEEGNEHDGWWYLAFLNGSDDVTYVLLMRIVNTARVAFVFKELNEEVPQQHATIECLNFDRQKTAQGVIINCSQQDGRRLRVEVRTPDNSELSFSFTPNETLQLNFKSRGLPYWFKNGFGFRSGFEDPSTVSGVLTKGGEKIQLEGYGIFERVLYDMTQYRDLYYNVWRVLNFDQGYVFLFESKSRGGYTTKSAAVSINGKYSYVNDPTKITIEHTIENRVVKKTHFIIETDYGKFESYGTLFGAIGSLVLIHAHTGTFTYSNGDVLELSGGIDIGCICL